MSVTVLFYSVIRRVMASIKRSYIIDNEGAEVGLCTSSWERLKNLLRRANAETHWVVRDGM
jgi:hypothetical protein